MRRKKDDKRVLRSGNGRQNNSKRILRPGNGRQNVSKRNIRIKRNNHSDNRPIRPRGQPIGRRNKKQRKASKGLMLIMIVALVAFVIGAGIGVSLTLNDDGDDGPHYTNVTKEMTSNLNDTEEVYFEKNVDDVDFNENVTSQYNLDIQQSEEN